MLYVLTFFVKKSNFECIKNKLIDFYFKINFNFHLLFLFKGPKILSNFKCMILWQLLYQRENTFSPTLAKLNKQWKIWTQVNLVEIWVITERTKSFSQPIQHFNQTSTGCNFFIQLKYYVFYFIKKD